MSLKTFGLCLMALSLTTASAEAAVVRGKVIRAEGRKNSSCRIIGVRTTDNAVLYLRLPSTADGDAMLSVALSALVSKLSVEIQYAATGSATCGGTEPDVDIIAIMAD